MLTKRLALIALCFALCVFQVVAQDLPACDEREYLVEYPRVDPALWCLEASLEAEASGEMAFTALAFGDDGTLYATRPLSGEVLAIRDTDGDRLVDTPTIIIGGLHLPNGLAFANKALYIMGDGMVYRYAEGETTILVDDLPHGRGFMASGIAIHEERLYVAIPFPCDFCLADDELEGTVLSFALDGSEQKMIARGLRYPSGLQFYEGALWVTDTARDGLDDMPLLDELNRIDLDSEMVPHFGFPYCYGLDNSADILGDFDCTTASPPTLIAETHSTPLAILAYDSDLFSFLTGDLLVVFAGSFDNSQIRGYSIVSIDFVRDDGRIRTEAIVPADPVIAGNPRSFYTAENGVAMIHSTIVNQRGAGIWPHRIFAVAVSDEGWIYMSANSRIYVLRPSDWDVCAIEYRECK
jgi:glucose/arabinose dehydrogenase